MRILILILLLSKVMQIYDHYWPTDPLDIHFEPPRLNFEPRKPMNFEFNDPDPAFNSNASPDSKNNADPCGSGSASEILLFAKGLYRNNYRK